MVLAGKRGALQELPNSVLFAFRAHRIRFTSAATVVVAGADAPERESQVVGGTQVLPQLQNVLVHARGGVERYVLGGGHECELRVRAEDGGDKPCGA